MEIAVAKIDTPEQLDQAHDIRRRVFVEEQNVSEREEYDEYEPLSTHFLASSEGIPVGTARWRFTDKGIKLERFAVLKDYRDHGVGAALLTAVLADVAANPDSEGKKIYLHAQIAASNFYKKHGFMPEGEVFYEANIAHTLMSYAH